jgi:hypothetical protein
VEAKGATCKQADAGVQGFDAGVGEAVNEGVEDRLQVLVDALDQLLKGLQLGGFRPLQPGLQEIGAASKGSWKRRRRCSFRR